MTPNLLNFIDSSPWHVVNTVESLLKPFQFKQLNETTRTTPPRYGTADEIAGLVAYLASPEASFVTGASLTIDGGFTAQILTGITS